jgi:hypothetical protein
VNTGDYAGQLIVTDAVNSQLSASGGRGYLKHTAVGTHAGQPDSAAWAFQWQAPAAGTGPVVFYWCNNAANNNGASSGDIIIRDSLVVAEASGVGSEREHGRFAWRYSNPSRNAAVIRYHGSAQAPVRIYAPTGRLVRCLQPVSESGILRVKWNGCDVSGNLVPEGTYFVRLGAGVTSVVSVRLVR